MSKLKIGISHGDINGIGYEIILKTFSNDDVLDLCIPVIYGSPKIATYHRNAIGCQTNFNVVSSAEEAKDGELNLINCFGEQDLKIDLGKPTLESGQAAYQSLDYATNDLRDGKIDAIVTAPINKNTIQNNEFHFAGHTEYLEKKLGNGKKALMILMNDILRVALVTTHLPVSQIASHITAEVITEKLHILNDSLKKDFAIDNPRIAVLGLNPHCGDGGLLGTEENEIIKPVIDACFKDGIRCFGPYPADGFFGSGNFRLFDAVLAMYHDQGLAPFKALAMEDGVNYTAGLPFIRTSPDHGTAYDIVGKNVADESSFRHALYSAIDICRNRSRFAEANAHPLRRQYYEKRDDSDKLKFDQISDVEI